MNEVPHYEVVKYQNCLVLSYHTGTKLHSELPVYVYFTYPGGAIFRPWTVVDEGRATMPCLMVAVTLTMGGRGSITHLRYRGVLSPFSILGGRYSTVIHTRVVKLQEERMYLATELQRENESAMWLNHRVHTERHWPLSGVHSIMTVKSAKPGGCTPSLIHSIYHHEQICGVLCS